MKQETWTVYRCEYCNKPYRRKYYCEKHERGCFHNPENERACFHCIHLTKKSTPVNNCDYDVNIYYCPIIKSFIYPPKVGVSGNKFQPDEADNIPMPKDCEHQNSGWNNLLTEKEK